MVRYRVGIVGCGFFGASLSRELASHPRFELTTVCDRDRDRATALGTELGVTTTVDHTVPADDDAIDLVVIATPNHTHTEPALAALQRGTAVFVEKPLAVELSDARAMIAAAAEAGATLMVGHIMRMMPGVRRLAAAVRAGDIGDVTAIETSRCRWIDTAGADPQWWKLDTSRTGGELTHEIHELDLLCWLGGEVSAAASAATADDGFRNTVVTFAGGAVGSHTISTRSHTSSWDLTVNGTRGALRADFRGGRVDLLADGRIQTSWPVFDDPAANDSLIGSAARTQKYNSNGGSSPAWMRAAIRHELDEMAAVLDAAATGTPLTASPLLESLDRALVVAQQVRAGHADPVASMAAR